MDTNTHFDLFDFPIEEPTGRYLFRLTVHVALGVNSDCAVWHKESENVAVFIGANDEADRERGMGPDAEFPCPLTIVRNDVLQLTRQSQDEEGSIVVVASGQRVTVNVADRHDFLVFKIKEYKEVVMPLPLMRPAKDGYRIELSFSDDMRTVTYYRPISRSKIVAWLEGRSEQRTIESWSKEFHLRKARVAGDVERA